MPFLWTPFSNRLFNPCLDTPSLLMRISTGSQTSKMCPIQWKKIMTPRTNTAKTSETSNMKLTSWTQMKWSILIWRFGSLMLASKENGIMRLVITQNAKKALRPSVSVCTVDTTMTTLIKNSYSPSKSQIWLAHSGPPLSTNSQLKYSKAFQETIFSTSMKQSWSKKPRRDSTTSTRWDCRRRKRAMGTSSIVSWANLEKWISRSQRSTMWRG